MKVNERIKELRMTNRLTLKEVADRIGVSEGTVQRYESGFISTVPYESIERIADLYGCDPAYVMGWQPEYHISDFKPIDYSVKEETEIVNAYRKAPDGIKQSVRILLGLERSD